MNILDTGITTPKGFEAAGSHVGIKKTKKDLAIIYTKKPALCSGVFTQNIVKAPPLVLCEETLAGKGKINAIVINSGNANSCTGEQGYKDALLMTEVLGECLNIPKENILPTSTGVIGVYLPMDKVVNGIKKTASKLSDSEKSAKDAVQGIMTTDTFEKTVSVEIILKGKSVKISGIAKGSGMIHPNMATMLGFITTDVNISQALLDKSFKSCISESFNMISVDGEQSTNDMCIILANGEAENEIIDKENEDYETFRQALNYVCQELAKKIVMDGEGATKFLEVKILNAKTKEDARVLCKSIINSNLVKTAFFGADANWGRILSAMGASGVKFAPDKVKIEFKNDKGKILLFENGLPLNFDEKLALEILSERSIEITVTLQEGSCNITGWGCDLSYEYVKINAEYRT